jgi:3-hydroxybutyryl-CoA dehydrogenase
MEIKNVTVFGSGVLGVQIAFQTIYHGYNVIIQYQGRIV